ncbi:hypothetical protein ACET3Z_016521 [Daucus carota]
MGLTNKTTLNLLVLLFYVLCFEPHLHQGTDVIGIGQTLSGNQTISSEGGTFELGFFTPDPAPGGYSLEVNTDSLLAVHYTYDGSRKEIFSSDILFEENRFISNFTCIWDANGIMITYEVAISQRGTRFMIDTEGKLKQSVCRGGFPECQWDLFLEWPNPQCDVMNFCGAFGTCNKWKVFPCDCLPGYERVSSNGDYSDGCIRKSRLECSSVGGGSEDTFLPTIVQIPNSSNYTGNSSQSLDVKSYEECSSGNERWEYMVRQQRI